MRTVARRVMGSRSPLKAGGVAAPPPPPPTNQHRQDWYDNRRGFGAAVNAGFGPGTWTTYTVDSNSDANTGDPVTHRGTLRWCLLQTGQTIVEFADGIGDILDVTKTGYKFTDNTLLDGYNWTGMLKGWLNSSNTENVCIMFMTVTQPFNHGQNPSGGVFTVSNSPGIYIYRCTGWDTGDVVAAGGSYQLSPGGSLDKPQPYYATVERCLWGPNPGAFAIMAPVIGGPGYYTYMGTWAPNTAYPARSSVTYNGVLFSNPKATPTGITIPPPYGNWAAPGFLNGVDNDPRNGKGMECAYDHQAVADGRPLSDFDHTAHVTMIENVLQGMQLRNGKSRDQYVDFSNNVITKFGTAFAYGGSALNNGVGTSDSATGTMNIEGNVYIYYEDGEQFLGWMDDVADAAAAANPTLGIERVRVVVPRTRNKVIGMELKAETIGNARIALNWLDGGVPVPAKFNTGFVRPYSLGTIPDRSNYANAQALVHQLCDDPVTKSGNPRCATQPPSWRAVHTASTFPVTP